MMKVTIVYKDDQLADVEFDGTEASLRQSLNSNQFTTFAVRIPTSAQTYKRMSIMVNRDDINQVQMYWVGDLPGDLR